MKIYPILWKHNQLKDGTYPLKIRVFYIDNGKKVERYYPLDIYLKESQWDDNSNRVKNHPNASDYNIKLLTTLKNLETQKSKDEPIIVKKAVLNGSFIEYYKNYITVTKSKYSASHITKLESILNKLEAHAPKLTFAEMTRDFLREYENHLINLGNNSTTRHDNFKRIKFIYDEAIADKIVNAEDSPFDKYKVKLEKTKKKRLSYSDISKIEKLKLKDNSLIWHIRNCWLFSFYCAGIRFSDLCLLQPKNIVNSRLVYTMHKSIKTSTPQHRNIKLMPKAKAIADHYIKLEKRYLFDLIDKLPKDKFEALKMINTKNSLANKYLKKLSKLIEANIDLSFHTSRHSFSDYAKKNGLGIHEIKELLGHSRVGTTEIYMKDFYEEESDEAMEKLFGTKYVKEKGTVKN